VTHPVDEVLSTYWEPGTVLRDPVLIVALEGLFDIASVATSALDWMMKERDHLVVADVDPDPFYDFTQQRPQVWIDDTDTRRIRWPENEFLVVPYPDGARDLVVLNGVEPHLGWATFSECVVTVARSLSCGLVVSLGAVAEQVPHTRVPLVVGSTTNGELAARLGLGRPQYQGPTGLAGVLLQSLDDAGLASVSLRVGVPHYLASAQHPKSAAALLQHLQHVLGVPTDHQGLTEEIVRWQELHDAAVAGDPQAVAYVAMLEKRHDALVESTLPTGDDLAAELEEFLRGRRDDDGNGGS
jgi:proteasome assembly chaperone (PAC2) family protein